LSSLQASPDGFREKLDAIEMPQIPAEPTLPNAESILTLTAVLKTATPELVLTKEKLDHQISVGEQKFNTEVNKLPSMKGYCNNGWLRRYSSLKIAYQALFIITDI